MTAHLALITAQLQSRVQLLADSYAPGGLPLTDAHRASLRAEIDAGFALLKAHWDAALFPRWPPECPGGCADGEACTCSEPEAEAPTAESNGVYR